MYFLIMLITLYLTFIYIVLIQIDYEMWGKRLYLLLLLYFLSHEVCNLVTCNSKYKIDMLNGQRALYVGETFYLRRIKWEVRAVQMSPGARLKRRYKCRITWEILGLFEKSVSQGQSLSSGIMGDIIRKGCFMGRFNLYLLGQFF